MGCARSVAKKAVYIVLERVVLVSFWFRDWVKVRFREILGNYGFFGKKGKIWVTPWS